MNKKNLRFSLKFASSNTSIYWKIVTKIQYVLKSSNSLMSKQAKITVKKVSDLKLDMFADNNLGTTKKMFYFPKMNQLTTLVLVCIGCVEKQALRECSCENKETYKKLGKNVFFFQIKVFSSHIFENEWSILESAKLIACFRFMFQKLPNAHWNSQM